MPLYEYRCQSCGRKVTVLVGMTADAQELRCEHCQSTDLRKLVSRFVRGRDEDTRIDEFVDQLDVMGEPDSASRARDLLREAGKAMDDDMSDEMEEMFEADQEGED
ncbi:MAG: zinc ribbon domain-containing protein [Chthonomonas sp.]|nr:zinc ribbon domain-containing protein [Chthonomonas sp.]